MTNNPTVQTTSTDFIPEAAITFGRWQIITGVVLVVALIMAPGSFFASLDVLIAIGLLLPRGNGDTFDKMRLVGLAVYALFRGLDLYGFQDIAFLDAITLAILASLVIPGLVEKLGKRKAST